MIVNGVDVREYGAKLLTVEEQPPKINVQKEMIPRALLPTEYQTDIPLGTLKMTIYFRAKNRAELQRTVSRFMLQFRQSAVLEEIKGYKGKYKAYLTDSALNKTLNLSKKILELSIDGYFFDDDLTIEFGGQASGKIYMESSRGTPCTIEITAARELTGVDPPWGALTGIRPGKPTQDYLRIRQGQLLAVPASGSRRKRPDIFRSVRKGKDHIHTDVVIRRAPDDPGI